MKLSVFTKESFGGLLNLIYPLTCGICNKKLLSSRDQDLSLCGGCLSKIKKNPSPYCKKCGRSLSGLTENVETCSECGGGEFYYERSWSCFLYEGVVKESLHLLKYSKKLFLSKLFCSLMTKFLEENTEILKDVDAAIAVPLHHVKLREREFNQAHILLEDIIKRFNIKDLSKCLRRTIATKPQSGLDKKERSDNIKGAFEIINPKSICGKNLLLVDDLFTTGATLNECARMLKKAGAGKIHCITFARGA